MKAYINSSQIKQNVLLSQRQYWDVYFFSFKIMI